MKKYIFIAILMISISQIAEAQGQKSYNAPELLHYVQSGVYKDGTLNLFVRPDYSTLQKEEKSRLLESFVSDFPDSKFLVKGHGPETELWVNLGDSLYFASNWNADMLPLDEYTELELNKYGDSRFFYYIGGSSGYSNGSGSTMVNLSAGTFLYKNIWDISANLGLGFMTASRNTSFSGNIGASTKVYLPWRIPKINLAPYAGAGLSLSFVPSAVFEGQLLLGFSCFVGPGSIDVGFKYGLKSKFAATFGYTFRPQLKIRK